jgi:histidine ammonia-lyase
VCAGRGLDLRAPLRPAPGTAAALAALREVVGGPGPDRFVSPDLEAACALVRSGELVAAVEGAVGELA